MDNNLPGGVTDNLTDFFASKPDEMNTPFLGGVSAFLLHVVVLAFAVYSGYHGVNATAHYRAAAGLGAAAGVIGILVIEATILGIYGAYFYRRITGDTQKWVAGVTFGVGFLLSCLGIVGDSQTQAGIEVAAWLRAYLVWLLPVAPALMALGAAGVLATEPHLQRLIRLALKREEQEEKRTEFQERNAEARLAIAENTANVQLNTMLMTNAYILASWKTPEVQAYIQANAIANVPDILRQVGVHVPYDSPLIIEGQIDPPAAVASTSPPPATPAPRQTLADRLRARLGLAPADTKPAETGPATHDAPRQDTPPAPPAATGQGGEADDLDALLDRLEARMAARAQRVPEAHANGQEPKTVNP